VRGSGAPKGACVTGRGVFPKRREQRHTATPVRRSTCGDFFVPGTVLPGRGEAFAMIPRAFALSLQPRPAIEGSAPSLGTDGYPRPPGSLLARHSRGRRIDRQGCPFRPALALSHFRIASRSAPHGQDTAIIRAVRQWG